MKVFELAKELDLKALDLIAKVKPLNLGLKNHMADLNPEQEEQIRLFLQPPAAPAKKKKATRKKVVKKKTTSTSKATVIRRKKADEPAPAVMIRKAEGEVLRKDPGEEAAPMDTSVSSGTKIADTVGPDAPEPTLAASVSSDVEAPGGAELLADGVESSKLLNSESPAAPVEPPPVPEMTAEERRRSKYSIIRVVSPSEKTPRRNLIVEAAPEKSASSAPKTFTDPELSRSGSALIRENEEEQKKKKAGASTKPKQELSNFKSTDFLRRERIYQYKKKRISIGRSQKQTQVTQAAAHKRAVEFDTEMSVENLAAQLKLKVRDVSRKLKELGVEQPEDSFSGSDWILDLETVQIVAAEFGIDVKDQTFDENVVIGSSAAVDDERAVPRPAVITIMGHVDHGKTSLLDIIRLARVAAGEAGGITQHIGAYQVNVKEAAQNLVKFAAQANGEKQKDKKKGPKEVKKAATGKAEELLTFLDTPGHAAFTEMRARGAKVTDIVVLVAAATDGVMPQTIEAINHAKAAGVPLIVAVNKVDLPEANPERTRQQLAEHNITPEEWGGENLFVDVSAKTGQGVDKLLETIQLQAEILGLKARADGPASGNIVEARLDKGRGPMATVLVSGGELSVGQFIVAGERYGKVRALIDDHGNNIKSAGPSTPVAILGLNGVPEAGDSVNVVEDERAAKVLVQHRVDKKREESSGMAPMSLEDLYSRMAQEDLKELAVVLKTDVKGSAEAIHAALLKMPQEKVKLKVLSAAVGAISENDVLLSSASNAIILGFNVRPDNKAQKQAESKGVQIKTYTVIYNLLDEVRAAMEGLLDPTQKETVVGQAEVRNVFNLSNRGTIAGCMVTQGKILRSASVRVLRDGRVVYTGKISGLRRFKDDAKEVAEGYECGISVENFSDIKVSDVLEAFSVENVKTNLTDEASGSDQARV